MKGKTKPTTLSEQFKRLQKNIPLCRNSSNVYRKIEEANSIYMTVHFPGLVQALQ